MTCHEISTACLFHVGASQNYCVSHLSSRRSDGGLTMQVSCVKDQPNLDFFVVMMIFCGFFGLFLFFVFELGTKKTLNNSFFTLSKNQVLPSSKINCSLQVAVEHIEGVGAVARLPWCVL